MELYEFFKSGRHPIYRAEMLESSLELSVNKIKLDDFTTICHDKKGNELVFLNGQLDSIGLRIGGNYNFKINGYELIHLSSFKYTINLLNNFEIEWWFIDKYSFQKQLCIQTSGGVQLMFDFSDKEEMLMKIILTLEIAENTV
ncbi:hypothetical protein [Aureibacter tunicatorum]|uniref:Uncharacterized protein n=1 Tax=Aureibacter tunicatorum TaxID=866807 RepID=A0AAE3XSD3_9BACT|nr:hypothetical protein [Aureibacter tunicatorum]MDR6241110.1 hypothetical protein [Aureibacter tunicatorum]BDD03888.1 hypothetical protein AUTU_13710 [Aureibacter tunicatorum]